MPEFVWIPPSEYVWNPSARDERRIWEMTDQGMSDLEIAEFLGVDPIDIQIIRRLTQGNRRMALANRSVRSSSRAAP